MNRELIGRALGWLLLALLVVGVPYLVIAFILWQVDPAAWEQGARFALPFLIGFTAFFTYSLLNRPRG